MCASLAPASPRNKEASINLLMKRIICILTMNIAWSVIVHALASITTLPRDLTLGVKYLVINHQIQSWQRKGWTIHNVFDKVASANPTKTAIQMVEGPALNFKELQEYSLKIANYFHKQGFVKDDVVALLMENQALYVGVWLGLSRIGIITALLNNGAKEDLLEQAVVHATQKPCKAIIASIDLIKEVEKLKSKPQNDLPPDMQFFVVGGTTPSSTLPNLRHIDSELEKDKDLLKPVDKSLVKGLDMHTKMVYVYTSGTTGHPKAATFSYKRFAFLAMAIHKLLRLRGNDVVYTPMPLYHASGGLVGTGQMLLFGNTMVVRKKFSKSSYFPDCKKYHVTVAQYIGEMCSYISTMDPSPADQDHQVRVMFGNGMRRALWQDFKKRFNIKQIGEFYGSTEGNTNMINTENVVGSVGYLPWFSNIMYPVELIEYNPETGDPIRNKNGFCVKAKTKGLLVGGIKRDAGSSFDGYADKEATKKKIITNVFKKGDAYFNSGDVLERDIYNNFYFVDRLGDTFRWKGENIAASQVETIIMKNMGLKTNEVLVYGVLVPNTEGRAGMAAFALDDAQFDKAKLVEVANKYLTKEQTPVFIRFTKPFSQTSTEKLMKQELKNQGWDPAKIDAGDKVYYFNRSQYQPVTQQVKDDIEAGRISF